MDDSPSSVDLSWDPPPYEMQNGRIRHYNIEITEVETGDVLEVTSNYTNITVNDLVPFYNYTCTISAETVADGPSSDEITFVLPEGRKFLYNNTDDGCCHYHYLFLILELHVQHLMVHLKMSLDQQRIPPALISAGTRLLGTSRMAT